MIATVSQATETEVKFLLPEQVPAGLDGHPLFHGCTVKPPSRQVATYFDTADRALARAGASFRLRRNGAGCVQTLKLRGQGGPFGRGEWEWRVKGDKPEPGRLKETPLPVPETALGAVFTAEVVRTLRRLRYEGATIEITVDEGSLHAGERTEPIRELELELKEGDAGALYRLAERLQAEFGLVLGTESKSDRGWRLVTGEARDGGKGEDIDLPRDIIAAEAFRRIAAMLLGSLLAHQPAAGAGVMEGVHGMRVATRRLRALLALFRPCLAAEPEARFTSELRDLAGILGAARDWDVFVTETLPGIDPPARDELRAAAEAERQAAHRRLAEELGRPAMTRLVLRLSSWAEDPAALSGEADGGRLAEPLRHLAPELLERLARTARRRGRHIRRRSEAELHELRKALKKLRYGVEFMASLHKEKRVSAYLQHCKRLQEKLGGLNDAVAAISLADRLAQENPALRSAVMALHRSAEERREEARHDLRKGWRNFRDAELPRPVR
ncbi:CYTH and CHAD domain-containing protein [Muricoccus aerilatus]|uniref:CYTH and CHAD domain-containing protein n=1 Tax=Muricoccus aerilatus TaxID=452982 RepID=UPI0014700BF1|nr:CYTH and CHAD domain-containing protein [Roseomonas aerilata]